MNKLKQYREQNKISQEKLSEEICVSRQTISFIENGGKPSYVTMEKIARHFGVPVSDIFFTDVVNHT